MHIREFRERIEGIEEHEELCSSFRVMIGNQFEFYLSRKEMDCEERTLVFVDIDRIQKENQIEEEWSIIPEECILKICNELDVPYNRSSELCYDDNGDSYIKAVICDLWNIISKLDSTRFMLAIIDLIQLNTNKYIEEYITRPAEEWLVQNGFSDFIAQKAFVAMWFSDTMKEARNAIKEAISECGYVANIIDEKEHNHDIVPEILYEIDNSKFLVADLTGNRGGVYYEAGYAKGIGKEVILTAKEGEKPHFDVAQVNTIFWKDEMELKDRLIRRIKSTIK